MGGSMYRENVCSVLKHEREKRKKKEETKIQMHPSQPHSLVFTAKAKKRGGKQNQAAIRRSCTKPGKKKIVSTRIGKSTWTRIQAESIDKVMQMAVNRPCYAILDPI